MNLYKSEKMSQSALLIGEITHARKEWESISSLLSLKVNRIAHCDVDDGQSLTGAQEFPSGTREEFIANCKAGQYDDVVALYRSNNSTKVRI